MIRSWGWYFSDADYCPATVCPSLGCTAIDRAVWASGGVFAQRGHSARAHSANYYGVYPGNTPENHPPTEACMINSKQHGVQNPGPWGPWLPVVENSWLFAQLMQSARCAPSMMHCQGASVNLRAPRWPIFVEFGGAEMADFH